jgi:hypothetical protein
LLTGLPNHQVAHLPNSHKPFMSFNPHHHLTKVGK